MIIIPTIIKSGVHNDERGNLFYYNDFDENQTPLSVGDSFSEKLVSQISLKIKNEKHQVIQPTIAKILTREWCEDLPKGKKMVIGSGAEKCKTIFINSLLRRFE